jgi:hypothetical protein
LLPAFEHIHAEGRVFVDGKRENILLCNGEQVPGEKNNQTVEGSSRSAQSKQRSHFKLTDFGLTFDPANVLFVPYYKYFKKLIETRHL